MLDYSFFSSRLEESFQVGDSQVQIKIESCERLKAYPGGIAEPFSVQFLGPADPILPQRTHTLSSPSSGTFEVFLVPISRDASGVRYEALFN